MKKGFFAGFAMSLLIVLLPVFLYMDARSSSSRPASAEISPNVPDPFLPGSSVPERPLEDGSPLSGSYGDDPGNPGIRKRTEIRAEERKAESIVMLSRPKDPIRIPSTNAAGGIRTRVYDPNRIYTLRTAISHVSLVDLPEEAKEVYMGDSKLFLAEVFGSRVKVKPISYDLSAKTNMIIYTLHKRFTFRVETVPAGNEDDLTTFLSPDAETVVNLNPLKTVIREHMEKKEAKDLEAKNDETLKNAGPTVPLTIGGESHRIVFSFLGFSRNRNAFFGLLEVQNQSGRPFDLKDVRIRKYRSGLFWEGQKDFDAGADWSQRFDASVAPGSKKRFLVRVGRIPGLSSREGIRIVVQGTLSGIGELLWKGDSGGVFR